METGHNYFTFEFDRQGARGCAFSLGERELAVTLDPFMGSGSSIGIYKMAQDRSERAHTCSGRFPSLFFLLPSCAAASSLTLVPPARPAERKELMMELVGHEGRITRALWGPLNRTILSAGEDGSIRLWDVEVRIGCCYIVAAEPRSPGLALASPCFASPSNTTDGEADR